MITSPTQSAAHELGRKLAEHGYANIDSPLFATCPAVVDPRPHLPNLMEELDALTDRSSLLASIDEGRKVGLIGYEKRIGFEPKTYIYYRPELWGFWEQRSVLRRCPTARTFLEQAQTIFHECCALRERILGSLEYDFPGIGSRFAGGIDVLKFVMYPPGAPCGVHVDPSPITLHLWEEHHGFFRWTHGRKVYIAPSTGRPLCFLGKTFAGASRLDAHARSHPPMWHGADPCPQSRLAVVFFIRDRDTFKAAHKPTDHATY